MYLECLLVGIYSVKEYFVEWCEGKVIWYVRGVLEIH